MLILRNLLSNGEEVARNSTIVRIVIFCRLLSDCISFRSSVLSLFGRGSDVADLSATR